MKEADPQGWKRKKRPKLLWCSYSRQFDKLECLQEEEHTYYAIIKYLESLVLGADSVSADGKCIVSEISNVCVT